MTTLNTYGRMWPDADESARAAVAVVAPARLRRASVGDIGFDVRGAAVLQDWLQIVRVRLPSCRYLG